MTEGWQPAFARTVAVLDALPFWILTLLVLTVALASFIATFTQLRRARLSEDMPTSRIRSAAQGYVELNGYARLMPGPEIRSPLSGARCVWWRYQIEHRETSGDPGRRSSEWRTLETATSDSLFLIADDSGDCVVDPDGATIHPSLKRRWCGSTRRPQQVPEQTPWLSFGNYRYHEQLLRIGDPLYALGWFRSQGNEHGYDESGDLRDLLRDWKADRHQLLARFDGNGDGQIDAEEWELVRRAALADVRQQHLQHSLDPDVHVLSRPRDRRPFLLSTLEQPTLARRYRATGLALLLLSLASGSVGILALTARGLL